MGQNIFKTTNILVGAKTVLSGDTSWQVSLPFVLEILFLVGVFCFGFFWQGGACLLSFLSPVLFFGSLTRPPAPSGFQEHPEDIY